MPRRQRNASFSAKFVTALAAIVLLVAWLSGAIGDPAPLDRMTTSAFAPAPDFRGDVAPRPMPLCGEGRRTDCVVDGDTLWLDGEKIRIVNIDAPEVKGRCRAETARAASATRALARLVADRPIHLVRQGEDRYGRTLAALVTPEGDVGEALVGRGLAARWHGRREPASTWCGAGTTGPSAA